MDSEAELGTPTCRCCRGEIGFRFQAPSWRSADWTKYEMGECSVCGTLNLLSGLEPNSLYQNYDRHRAPKQSRASSSRRALGRAAAATLLRRGPWGPIASKAVSRPYWIRWFAGLGVGLDTSILDIGSGGGALLQDLARHGFSNLNGIDPFLPEESAIDGPVRIRQMEIEHWTEPQGVCVLKHVLEHIDNPGRLLGDLHRILLPRGLVVVDVPVAQGPAWMEFRENLFSLDPPLHRFLPTERGLRWLAEASGFTVLRCVPEHPDFYFTLSELVAHRLSPLDPSSSAGLSTAEHAHLRRKALRARTVASSPQLTFILTPSGQ